MEEDAERAAETRHSTARPGGRAGRRGERADARAHAHLAALPGRPGARRGARRSSRTRSCRATSTPSRSRSRSGASRCTSGRRTRRPSASRWPSPAQPELRKSTGGAAGFGAGGAAGGGRRRRGGRDRRRRGGGRCHRCRGRCGRGRRLCRRRLAGRGRVGCRCLTGVRRRGASAGSFGAVRHSSACGAPGSGETTAARAGSTRRRPRCREPRPRHTRPARRNRPARPSAAWTWCSGRGSGQQAAVRSQRWPVLAEPELRDLSDQRALRDGDGEPVAGAEAPLHLAKPERAATDVRGHAADRTGAPTARDRDRRAQRCAHGEEVHPGPGGAQTTAERHHRERADERSRLGARRCARGVHDDGALLGGHLAACARHLQPDHMGPGAAKEMEAVAPVASP